MKLTTFAILMALLTGFGAAWNIQALRWDADAASIRQKASEDLERARKQQDDRIEQAENEKEKIQNDFEEFKRAEAERDATIGSGGKRVSVRAKRPSVPSSATDSGRAASGAAELDPAYRSTLSALRRGAEEQLRLLNICRAELFAR